MLVKQPDMKVIEYLNELFDPDAQNTQHDVHRRWI